MKIFKFKNKLQLPWQRDVDWKVCPQEPEGRVQLLAHHPSVEINYIVSRYVVVSPTPPMVFFCFPPSLNGEVIDRYFFYVYLLVVKFPYHSIKNKRNNGFYQVIKLLYPTKNGFDWNWLLNLLNLNFIPFFMPKMHFNNFLYKNELFDSSTNNLNHECKSFHDSHPTCPMKVINQSFTKIWRASLSNLRAHIPFTCWTWFNKNHHFACF